jgi:hypothetical protein
MKNLKADTLRFVEQIVELAGLSDLTNEFTPIENVDTP